ncbi:MAG: ABC transporter substrate-binding protein [Rhizonema sp. PD38]|nr:ABC transporter substrate-binding protein [Rhizonema sp. PD38]
MMRILFLTADPTDTATRLRLQEELRVMQETLGQPNLRKRFQPEYRFSVRFRDIKQAILNVKPHIVHFSGHGISTGELCFVDESGTMQPVKPEALADVFESVVANKVQVNCVVLNACYSDIPAKAIVKHIPFVIGMKQAIADQAAIAFSGGFYKKLALNGSIEDAFKSGCVEIQLPNEELTPVLHKKVPYEEEFRRWLDSKGKDKSSLLRGQKLRIAMEWIADKILTIEDYQYLNASQELEIRTLHNSRCIISGIAAILLIGIGVTGFQLKEKVQSLFLPYVLDPELFSQGERDFFLGDDQNYFLKKGIEYFEKSDYPQATSQFTRAKEIYNDDIEAEIYYNNARAHEQGNYLSLAVVVPINATKKLSKEILRGVALAQSKYNEKVTLKERLLNIVIVNDNDDPDQAQKVAQELIKDEKVLGVIGHASSAASKKALPEYQNAGLAMISSSSTSTELNMDNFKVFFRTIPSDEVTAKKLANYAINQGLKRVVIYYQQGDTYSDSFKQAFEKSLKSKGGSVKVKNFIEKEQDVNPPNEVIENKKDKIDADLFLPKFGLISTVTNIASEEQRMKENLKLLGGDTLYGSETLRRGKKAIEGLVVAVPWFAKESSSKTFADLACTRWGGGVSWETAASYDATQAFIKAMLQSEKPSRSTVLKELKSIMLSPDKTSGSELKFIDGERNNAEPVLVKVVKGSGDHCGGFQEGGFHFEKVPEK